MSKDLGVAVLLDYYGQMLTNRQRDVMELYYDEDLSLGEIAELVKITRQGVRDFIKRGEEQLRELESKLHLADKGRRSRAIMEELLRLSKELYEECTDYKFPLPMQERSRQMLECAQKLDQLELE